MLVANPVTATQHEAVMPAALGLVGAAQCAPAFDVGVQEGAVVFFNDFAGVTVVVHAVKKV